MTLGRAASMAAMCAALAFGQVHEDHPAASTPRLVRIADTFRHANGQTAAPVESVTLSV